MHVFESINIMLHNGMMQKFLKSDFRPLYTPLYTPMWNSLSFEVMTRYNNSLKFR